MAFFLLLILFPITNFKFVLTAIAPSPPAVTLDAAGVHAYRPYTSYAGPAYCRSDRVMKWNCPSCKANPTFTPIASGGDGVGEQLWFVGYDPALSSVIVAHQGTDVKTLVPLITDLNAVLARPNSVLFPGLSKTIKIHLGFGISHAKTAPHILNAVRLALSRFHCTHVIVIGHSLGGALALLDGVFLPLHLPGNITFSAVTYGMPRTGNQAFVDYVDAHLSNFTHITNRADPIPALPPARLWPLDLEYRHPSGEVHVTESGTWVACPGQDNPSRDCSTGSVNIVSAIASLVRTAMTLDGNLRDVLDHCGPYDGVDVDC